MLPADFHARIIVPAARLFPFHDSPQVQRILLAIAGQESGWRDREQVNGPARGFWQFERGGAVHGVMQHAATVVELRRCCASLEIEFNEYVLYEAVAWNDSLAYAMARLLLWSDPAPLPDMQDELWELYLRCWRPGNPKPLAWAGNWTVSALA